MSGVRAMSATGSTVENWPLYRSRLNEYSLHALASYLLVGEKELVNLALDVPAKSRKTYMPSAWQQ
jgi:hypothetical protein